MCVWQENSLIAVLIILDEAPVIHSVCCGLDYDHSKIPKPILKCIMNSSVMQSKQENIHLQILVLRLMKPTTLGFQPISACMDVWGHHWALKCSALLFLFSNRYDQFECPA